MIIVLFEALQFGAGFNLTPVFLEMRCQDPLNSALSESYRVEL